MSDVAIKIEGLGKKYRYGGVAPLSSNLRADLTDFARRLLRRSSEKGHSSSTLHPQASAAANPSPLTADLGSLTSGSSTPSAPSLSTVHREPSTASPSLSTVDCPPSTDYFWALRDINLEIKQGEVVGIIGRNGAGKSTLLKILSRITTPTTGKITYHGRVASLLEVGTGFHRELTGRENIYLNGGILGMRRTEIARKFDEIIAFAEVEQFVNTPVKFYSSGMYVRLAFAVAAHLETDIMLVDEVLAVGDAAFQQKCLGKMDAVAKTGRTVLFVSHNMGMIQTLCPRAVLIRQGTIFADGASRDVTQAYLAEIEGVAKEDLATRKDRRGNGQARLVAATWQGKDSPIAITGQPVRLEFTVSQVLPTMSCTFNIYSPEGHPLAFFTTDAGRVESTSDRSAKTFVCEIDELLLLPGRYRINVALYSQDRIVDHVEGACVLDVHQGTVDGKPTIQIGSEHMILRHRWLRPSVNPII